MKFEFKTLYVQFRNAVGRRKVFLNESDEITKSDVCIQAIQQRYTNVINARSVLAAHINNRSERETLQ